LNFSNIKCREENSWLNSGPTYSDAQINRWSIRILKKRVKTYQNHINHLDKRLDIPKKKWDMFREYYRKDIKNTKKQIKSLVEKL
jgi:hypothetical protein